MEYRAAEMQREIVGEEPDLRKTKQNNTSILETVLAST